MRPLPVDGGWGWPGEVAAGETLAGLRPGARLALGGLNHPATAQLLAAALRRGLTVIPFNRRLSQPELRRQHARARADRTLAHPGHPLAEAVACETLPEAWAGPASGGPLDGALVLFTSGTTGEPRAVRLGADAIRAALAAHVAALALGPADTWSLPLPLDHVGGIMGTLRALVCGCAVTLEATPGADATGASLVPTMLARLVAAGTAPPPHLRTALTGGGPLDPQLAEAARRLGWPVRETYGLTEMGSMVTLDGVPVPGARLRLEDGRILVGGAMRCDGYEGDHGLLPAAEWHLTGDLGELVDGRLRITGRQAELIVSGGENVAAPEVEAALTAHPLVAEACVVGLPDAAWGECVAAAVVLRGAIDGDGLAAWLQPRLAGYKRPRRWRFVDALPRTALGKLQRHLVRGLFA
jgi:O-succinylbenzoic acid--CoA ligase